MEGYYLHGLSFIHVVFLRIPLFVLSLQNTTPNLQQRCEAELKKEIKKLQRHRDQLKLWIGGSEIREKDRLKEARKTIETRMEAFKQTEKDLKTKAYSKEGLAKAEKLDPLTIDRNNSRDWYVCVEFSWPNLPLQYCK